ncbi:MAG: carboxypeptidase regulatory-like domain-containing protein [Gemmatimonadaceae bacterium]|nr:carboxypeptidase regulatory-like domain-containing protein [Gemmatimonadaceae bacterium]
MVRRHWPTLQRVGTVVMAVLCGAVPVACGNGDRGAADGARIADVEVQSEGVAEVATGPVTSASLTRSAGGPDGLQYTVRVVPTPGVILGEVRGGTPHDTSITPTHDLSVCKPFTESLVPSRDGGVGNAVAWLVGVSSGPRDEATRRARLTLDGCRLEPRIQRVAAGATVLVHGRDAMMSRLQLVPLGERTTRSTILLTDAGQVVPSDEATREPALLEVRDDLHPWVRAYLVVSPHPFVAVTDADGDFRFDGVPPGRYTLLVWHERLGVQRKQVKVEGGVQVKVRVEY